METDVIELEQLARPKHANFGEFLVTKRVLDRFQLLRSLQLQDKLPNTRLGQCAVVLGYAPPGAIEALHAQFRRLAGDDLDDRETEAFVRIEIDVASA